MEVVVLDVSKNHYTARGMDDDCKALGAALENYTLGLYFVGEIGKVREQ